MCWSEQQRLSEERKSGGGWWWQKGDDALGIEENTGRSCALWWAGKRSRGEQRSLQVAACVGGKALGAAEKSDKTARSSREPPGRAPEHEGGSRSRAARGCRRKTCGTHLAARGPGAPRAQALPLPPEEAGAGLRAPGCGQRERAGLWRSAGRARPRGAAGPSPSPREAARLPSRRSGAAGRGAAGAPPGRG